MISELNKVNPFLFFFIKEGKVIAWDYKNHQQYELEMTYFERLLALANDVNPGFNVLDAELAEAGFIADSFEKINWGWDLLSQVFHFGTKIRNDDIPEAIIHCPENYVASHLELARDCLDTSPAFSLEREGELCVLPAPDLQQLASIDYLQVLKNRKTSRSFDNEAIDIQTLSNLLYVVFGDFHPADPAYKKYGYKQVGLRKTSPSAGGLHPSEAYLFAINVSGLEQGIYHYQAHKHALTLIHRDCSPSALTRLLCGQYFAKDLSLGIFIASRFEKVWHKYPHSRAYRVALMDVGHLSQTFQLSATALGLNTWLSGVFMDVEVEKLLKINETSEQVLFFMGAGLGDNSPIDPVAKEWNVRQ